MKLIPKWRSIVVVDILLIIGMVTGGYFVIRHMLFSPGSNPDYLVVLLFVFVILFSIVNILYIQYRQLNTVFTEEELIRPRIFGHKHYKWSELVLVTIKMQELVIKFETGNVRLMLQLYNNSDELLAFVHDRYRNKEKQERMGSE
jgi:hypothetical protein